jgi:hypothetical protein
MSILVIIFLELLWFGLYSLAFLLDFLNYFFEVRIKDLLALLSFFYLFYLFDLLFSNRLFVNLLCHFFCCLIRRYKWLYFYLSSSFSYLLSSLMASEIFRERDAVYLSD